MPVNPTHQKAKNWSEPHSADTPSPKHLWLYNKKQQKYISG